MNSLTHNKKRLTVAVAYGGRSGEHDVSVQSATSVLANLSRKKYLVREVYIDRHGGWHRGQKGARESAEKLLAGTDVVFPLVHGTFGEDGCLPGLLEMLDLAYVGSGVLGSAVGMDKDMQKKILANDGLPVVPWLAIVRTDWNEAPIKVLRETSKCLGSFPLFVKPANLGSSVGISKAHDRQELIAALKLAFQYDRKVVVERAVTSPREIEVAVIGNERPQASLPGEVMAANEFYDYDAKYHNELSRTAAPAKLSRAATERVRHLAMQAYRSLATAGFARVDFLIDPQGKIFLNEINTIPGFTTRSMFPLLWSVSGLKFPQLLDRLITLALERKKDDSGLRRDFSVNKS